MLVLMINKLAQTSKFRRRIDSIYFFLRFYVKNTKVSMITIESISKVKCNFSIPVK